MHIYNFRCVPLIAITCGHPGNPTFGLTQGTQFNLNDAVRFVCNTGYVLQGKGRSSCQANGQWSNVLPRCKSKRAIAFFFSVCGLGYQESQAIGI